MKNEKKITIFIGNMGSGKSEIAINYTFGLMKSSSKPVKLLDLDIIKPYIRIRDIADTLVKEGLDLLLPDKKIRHADMPIIPADMTKYLYDPSYDLVIDVGGEDRGSITIAQFKDQFADFDVKTYVVINAMRPFSNTPEKIVTGMKELSHLSKLSIDGIIANSHLRFLSSLQEVEEGLIIIQKASDLIGTPIYKVAVWDKLMDKPLPEKLSEYSIMPLKIHLMFPWEKTNSL